MSYSSAFLDKGMNGVIAVDTLDTSCTGSPGIFSFGYLTMCEGCHHLNKNQQLVLAFNQSSVSCKKLISLLPAMVAKHLSIMEESCLWGHESVGDTLGQNFKMPCLKMDECAFLSWGSPTAYSLPSL